MHRPVLAKFWKRGALEDLYVNKGLGIIKVAKALKQSSRKAFPTEMISII
jgi:hypothetical protein